MHVTLTSFRLVFLRRGQSKSELAKYISGWNPPRVGAILQSRPKIDWQHNQHASRPTRTRNLVHFSFCRFVIGSIVLSFSFSFYVVLIPLFSCYQLTSFFSMASPEMRISMAIFDLRARKEGSERSAGCLSISLYRSLTLESKFKDTHTSPGSQKARTDAKRRRKERKTTSNSANCPAPRFVLLFFYFFTQPQIAHRRSKSRCVCMSARTRAHVSVYLSVRAGNG